jgi:hypothetical protein
MLWLPRCPHWSQRGQISITSIDNSSYPVNRQGRAPQQPQMDQAMQQFIQARTELLQNLSNIVVNLQAQVNNQPQ